MSGTMCFPNVTSFNPPDKAGKWDLISWFLQMSQRFHKELNRKTPFPMDSRGKQPNPSGNHELGRSKRGNGEVCRRHRDRE